MLRILHTSDWHLGHQLHDLSREREHDAFLDWLVAQIQQHRVDALLVAGDVFHTANPSARATSQWYDFLARLGDELPALDVVAIAGNHDSAARIESSVPLLPARHTIVGRSHRHADGSLDVERMLVPLHDASGAPAAWVLAVPFLRPQDLAPDTDTHGAEYQVRGTQRVYRELLAAARDRAEPHQAIIALGHMHMVKAAVSEGSERRVFGGAEHIPADTFNEALAYVALGHLHRPQRIGGQERLRYSGSPIPLSMDEEHYPHQVVLVDLDGPRLHAIDTVAIPRAVEVLRLPASGPCRVQELGPHLAALPTDRTVPQDEWPYLEVRVLLDEPSPTLRAEVDEKLADKAVRLVRLSVSYPARNTRNDEDPHETRDLSELKPDELFSRMWWDKHGGEPDDAVMTAFHALVDDANQREGGAR